MNAKIKITIGKKELEFTPEEARQLKAELEKIFEPSKSLIQQLQDQFNKMKPQKEYVPMPYPLTPYYVQPSPPPRPYSPRWDIYCSSDISGINSRTVGALTVK
jgi:hypothetical protein